MNCFGQFSRALIAALLNCTFGLAFPLLKETAVKEKLKRTQLLEII